MKLEHIEETKTGYRVKIAYRQGEERKYYSKSFNFKDFSNKTACLNHAKQHRDLMKHQLGVIKTYDNETTLEEVYELKKLTYSLAPGTDRMYDCRFKKYVLTVIPPNTIFSKISHIDILRCLDSMVYTCSQDTINRINTLWEQLYKTALINKIVSVNEHDKVMCPKSRKPHAKRNVMTTRDEIDEVLEKLPQTEYADKVRLMIEIMYYTGMRSGEVVCLETSDIDFENGLIHVNKGISYNADRKPIISTLKNTHSERFIPIHPNILEELETLPSGFIFEHKGHLMYAEQVDSFLRKYKTNLTLYKIRHLFATDLLIKENIDAATVKELMGHSSVSTTLSYVRTNKDVLKDAINRR